MMYVIYNNDGSIKYKLLNEFVEQGNNNVNELFVAIEDRENWALYASFKLPNGATTTVVSSTPTTEFIEGIGTFTGRKILLSNAETLVAGALQMNVVCLDENDAKLVAFNTYITVNETGIQLSDPILLTVQEYENLLAELKRKMEYPTKYVQVSELPDNPSLDTIYVLKGANDLNEVFMYNGKTESWIPLGSNRINLGLYYTKEEGEEFESEIDARVTSVEDELSSVASGTPKGAYATLSALETAYPTGAEGIYVVLEDGLWYFWNSADSEWAPGGVYLSPGIEKGTGIDISNDGKVSVDSNVQSILNRVPINNQKKTHLIYSWCEQLGPHSGTNLLGHFTLCAGYTTTDYLLVNIGDTLTLTIQTGVSEIQVHEYTVDDNGKIITYLGKNTYTSSTNIIFGEKRIIRVSVRGSSTPSFALAQSCAKIISYRNKEDIFVYPYGKWEYCVAYYWAGQNPDTVAESLNGDPYYDTVAKSFVSNVWAAYGNARLMVMNLNYAYVKYGITKPSILRTAYYKNNNIASFKLGLVADDGAVNAYTSSFENMENTNNCSIMMTTYNGNLTNIYATTQKSLYRVIIRSKTSEGTTLITTKEEGDTLFDSFEIKDGFVYNGDKVDLKRHTRKNELKYTYKGLFPFISTQNGGQKPSSMSQYNGKLFIGCDNYGCNIVDLSDLSLVASISDNQLGHFNNCEFTNEKYDATDTYPLLLTGNGNNAYNPDLGSEWGDYLKLIRFANDLTSFSVVKKYIFRTNQAGFYVNTLGIDNDNKTLWLVCYTGQDWTNPTNNDLILTSWDLTDCEIDNNGNYIPKMKTRCVFPYVRGMQDMTFCNGYLFMLAASPTQGTIPAELYIFDTTKQTMRKTEINYVSNVGEIEAITNIYDDETDKYYLLLGEALYVQSGGVNGTYGHIYRLDTID